MQRLTSTLLVSALLANSQALAQNAIQTVTVRPVKEPTGELDRQVALGARPVTLTRATYPDAADLTATMVVRALCGEVRSAYIAVLEETNRQVLMQGLGSATLPLERKLGPLAYEMVWPACLIVDTQPAAQVISRGRPPETIYTEMTGDRGSRSAIASFFGLSYAQLSRKKLGDPLTPARLTLPVDLVVEHAELAQTIDVLRDKAAKASDPPARIVEVVAAGQNPRPPSLIIGTGELSALATPHECKDAQPPVAPSVAGGASLEEARRARVLAALGRTRDRMQAAHRGQLPVEVMVVDNGFLGAVKSGGAVVARPGFAASFQARQYDGNVGPALELDQGLVFPLIDPPTPWSDVAGHGTHVVGLAGGGPDLQAQLEPLVTQPGAGSQLTVAMVNVGAGRRELLPGSAEALRLLSRLSRFRIWNFSLEYPDTSNRVIHRAFTNFFDAQDAHLFVAAAGNDGQPVGNRYPAAFGGPTRRNVITVGATLPDGTLAEFSAWGSQVDIAAPGCDIRSTINDAAHLRGMTGTSQAAPQVSLAAALLRIFATLDAPDMKTRLIVSGALIKPPPSTAGAKRQPAMVWSRSALDVERAVDVFEDFVEMADGRQYVGTMDALIGTTCANAGFATPIDGGDLWSFKREAAGAWIFTGRSNNALPAPPCQWTRGSGKLTFIPTARVDDTGYHALAPDDAAMANGDARLDEPLSAVSRLILAYDMDNLR